jgi:hypothetical protein
MVTAEMNPSAKALPVKQGEGCTSDELERVRTRTEATFGESPGEAHLSSFSRLGAMFLAEEAYVMDFCKRFDRADILPESLASE